MKNLAVLSFIVEDVPGGRNRFIDEFDVLNLPNPGVPHVNNFFS